MKLFSRVIIAAWFAIFPFGNAFAQSSGAQTLPNLITEINTYINSNGTGGISGAVLNPVLQAIANSIIKIGAPNGVSPVAFGALCDGVTDDTTAIQAWAASVTLGSTMYLPGPNKCVFKSAIVFPAANNVTIQTGGHGAGLLYAGAGTSLTAVTIGATVNGCSVYNWTLRDLSVMSSTVMTGGAGLKLFDVCQSVLSNVEVGGGLNGNNNWFNGLVFVGGNTINMNGYALQANSTSGTAEIVQGDAAVQITDLAQTDGTIGHSLIGLNIAGNVGGFHIANSDVLFSSTNIRISQDKVAVANLQVFLDSGTVVDITSGAPGVGLEIADPGSNNSVLMATNVWWATAQGTACFLMDAAVQWYVVVNGGLIYNCLGDGFKTLTAASNVQMVGTYFGSNGGFGINATLDPVSLNLWNISFGANIGGNFNTTWIHPISYTTGQTRPIMHDVQITSQQPNIRMVADGTGANPANQKIWDWLEDTSGNLNMRAVSDDYTAANNWATVQRSGFVPTVIQFYEGAYVPSIVLNGNPPTAGGTCSINTQTGGNYAGTFKSGGACAAGTVTLNFAIGAAHGFVCDFHDQTTPADLMNQTASTGASVTATGTMALNDIVAWKCLGN